jgi:hypothetical protein
MKESNSRSGGMAAYHVNNCQRYIFTTNSVYSIRVHPHPRPYIRSIDLVPMEGEKNDIKVHSYKS